MRIAACQMVSGTNIEANIHTPVAVDIDFILCVCRPLMRHMTITTIHSDGINLG